MADDSGTDEIAFDIPTTLADHAAFLLYVTRRPRRLAIHAAFFVGLGLLICLFEIALGLVTALFTARHGLGDAVQRYIASGMRQDLASSWQVTVGIVGGIFLLNVLVLTPRQCRLIAARLLAAYPESASGHPTPTLVSHLRFDARGAESGTENERVALTWPMFTRLAETSRYLFVMSGRSAGLILPKRALDAEQIARVRDICERFLAASRSPAP